MNNFARSLGNLVGRSVCDVNSQASCFVDFIDNKLSSYGSDKLDAIYDVRKKLAMQNSEYAAIEARRATVDGSIVFLSDEHDLTLDDWIKQDEIFSKLSSEPLSSYFYRSLYNKPLKKSLRTVLYAFQKLTRGWDDSATWSLDAHLCETLGAQLNHLADTTHGWPESEKYPTFEDWKKDLKYNAGLLLQYKEHYNYSGAEAEKYVKDAQKALRWVAVMLPHLWD